VVVAQNKYANQITNKKALGNRELFLKVKLENKHQKEQSKKRNNHCLLRIIR
jgi:hypothetical protein